LIADLAIGAVAVGVALLLRAARTAGARQRDREHGDESDEERARVHAHQPTRVARRDALP
jgi:hypothetical protein